MCSIVWEILTLFEEKNSDSVEDIEASDWALSGALLTPYPSTLTPIREFNNRVCPWNAAIHLLETLFRVRSHRISALTAPDFEHFLHWIEIKGSMTRPALVQNRSGIVDRIRVSHSGSMQRAVDLIVHRNGIILSLSTQHYHAKPLTHHLSAFLSSHLFLSPSCQHANLELHPLLSRQMEFSFPSRLLSETQMLTSEHL